MEMISGLKVVFFTLGFRKIDADRWEFANEDFLRGKRTLLKNISRCRSSQIQHIGTQVSSSLKMGKSESEGELQKLRREKDLMMEEVVRLKQEHLITVQQMGALNQRMQSAELRQKQMVSFLAKVLQNPVFLAHLKQQKEQRDVVSRVKRKFLRQHQPSQIDSDKSMEQQIVKYRLDFRDTTSSSPKQGIESGTSKQLPDYILQDMVGKLGIDKSEQEPLGGSYDPGARMLDPSFLDSDTASFKRKGLVNFETDVNFSGGEYFVNSPDDIAPDKMLSDVLVPSGDSSSMTGSRITPFKGKSVINFETDTGITGTEHPMLFLDTEDVPQEKMLVDTLAPATNNEETWNVDFEAGGSSFSTGHDVWDDLVHYDDQGFEFADGAFAFWDLGLRTPEEGHKIDMYVGGESSSQEHRDEGGVLNEDRPKDLEP